MRLSNCPGCGEKVSPSDTVCLDCGVNLVEAAERVRQQMQEQSMAGRTGQWQTPTTTAVGPGAGQGRPGETVEAVRLRVFDKQAVKGLTHEMITSFIIALGVLVAGVVLVSLGNGQLKAAGGLGGFQLAALRTVGGIASPGVLAIVLLGSGAGGLLVAMGQVWRGIQAWGAIADTKAERRPRLVSINFLLQIGLLLIAVCCPPAGLLLGVLLRLSDDSDIKDFAQLLVYISLIVAALLLINLGLGLAEGFRKSHNLPANAT